MAPQQPSDAFRLRRCIRILVRRFALAERADVECCGVTVAQAATLEALYREGGLRLGDLGRRLGITPSTLTRNLTRLEEKDLVTKVPDPDDRRASQVVLTASGAKAARTVEDQEEAFASAILEQLPHDQVSTILDSLEELLGAIRTATESCCQGAFDHLMEESDKG